MVTRGRCLTLSTNFPAFETWMVRHSRGLEVVGFAAAMVLKISATRVSSMAQFLRDWKMWLLEVSVSPRSGQSNGC